MLKNICGTLSFISLIVLIGTAGASDYNEIPLIQAVVQSILSLAAFSIFARLAGAFDYTKNVKD